MTSSHPREISERGILLILLAVGLLPLLGDATFGSWSEEDRGLGERRPAPGPAAAAALILSVHPRPFAGTP